MIDRDAIQSRLTRTAAKLESGNIVGAKVALALLRDELHAVWWRRTNGKSRPFGIVGAAGTEYYRAAAQAVRAAEYKLDARDIDGAIATIREALTLLPQLK